MNLPKELRLDVAITVPDEILEQSEVIAKAKPIIKKLLADLCEECGADNVRGDVALVSPRVVAPKDAPLLVAPVEPLLGARHARGHTAEEAEKRPDAKAA